MTSGIGLPLIVLRHRPEFLAVAASGRKWVAPGLIVQIGKAPDTALPRPVRYGLTASGKIGSAVVRNRARRRLRALANEVFPYHASLLWDYVIIARAQTPKREYGDLRQDLITALKKLGAWREP